MERGTVTLKGALRHFFSTSSSEEQRRRSTVKVADVAFPHIKSSDSSWYFQLFCILYPRDLNIFLTDQTIET